MIVEPKAAKRSRRGSRARPARPSSRASMIRQSSPARGQRGWRSSTSSAAQPPRILIPCGGGGLASGIALAVPEAEIVVVEPEGWDDMGRSLERGEIVPVEADAPDTFCDAIMTPRVSPITFGILSERTAKAVSVSDAEVEEAIRFAWKHHNVIVEPGAAVGLAALLAGKVAPTEDTVVCFPVEMSIRRCTRGSSATRARRRCASYIRRARRGRGWSARPPWSAPRARLRASCSSPTRKRRSFSATDSEASISVSSIIAMHGRIVSSIRSNASSRRTCCSALGMAPICTELG